MLVYLDMVMVLNFLVDFLLLLGSNQLTGYPPEWRKASGGALLGSLYAGACLLPGFGFLGNFLWRTVFLCLMAVLAFGWNKNAVQRGAVFLLLSMALGGIASGIRMVDFGAMCLCAFLLWALCRVGFRGEIGSRQYIPVEMSWQGKHLSLMALIDTGNLLRDPLTGEQVLICGCDVGEELFGIEGNLFADPVAFLSSGRMQGWRLISYHGVGNEGGMLPALRIKNVRIGKNVRDAVVAFAPNRIGEGDHYRMLTGGR